MKVLEVVIVDDEPLAVILLSDYVEKHPQLKLKQSFKDPIVALQYLQTSSCDLLFLDIQMPGLTGVQLMRILPADIPVIITTAFPEFALDGFEQNAIDYLLKPISFERFNRGVEKYLTRMSAPEEIKKADFIFVKSGHRIQKVMLSDILWFEGMRDYVAIHTSGKKRILTLQKMKSFEDTLPPTEFVRIHKSYLISISKIDFIEKNAVRINHNSLPVSETYRSAFLMRLKE